MKRIFRTALAVLIAFVVSYLFLSGILAVDHLFNVRTAFFQGLQDVFKWIIVIMASFATGFTFWHIKK